MLLCSPKDGYVPRYDPGNEEYGCVRGESKLDPVIRLLVGKTWLYHLYIPTNKVWGVCRSLLVFRFRYNHDVNPTCILLRYNAENRHCAGLSLTTTDKTPDLQMHLFVCQHHIYFVRFWMAIVCFGWQMVSCQSAIWIKWYLCISLVLHKDSSIQEYIIIYHFYKINKAWCSGKKYNHNLLQDIGPTGPVDERYRDEKLEAMLAKDDSSAKDLHNIPGADGFSFSSQAFTRVTAWIISVHSVKIIELGCTGRKNCTVSYWHYR